MLRTVRADRGRGPPAPGPHRREPGARLHGPGRRELPQDVHRARRHRRARRPPDGARRRGRDLGLVRGVRARRRVVRGERARAVPGEGQERAGARRRPRRARQRESARADTARRTSCRSSIASGSAPSSPPRSRRSGWASARSSSSSASPASGSRASRRSYGRTARTCAQIALRCEQYETSTPYYAVSPVPPLAPRRRAERRRRAQPRGARRTPRLDRRGARSLGSAARGAARRRGRDDARGRRPRSRRSAARVSTASSARCSARLLDSPTLLVLEDVHWMDDASSELLRHLGTQLPTRPWLTCTTRRAVEGGFAAAEGTPPLPALTLRLEPLPVDDAKALVRAAAGDRRLTDEELAALMERGAGNPLFLQELAVARAGAGRRRSRCRTPWRRSSRRASTASPRATARSCAGRPFSACRSRARSSPTCSRTTRRPRPTRRRGTGSASSSSATPTSPGAFRFRHALIRDGAYEGLSYRRRRELHGRVAEVLERTRRPTPSSCSRSTTTGPTTSPRHGATRSRRGGAHRRSGRTSRRPSSTSARSRSPTESPSSTPTEIAEAWEALGDCRQLAGKLERRGGRIRAGARASTGGLARGDRAPLQGSHGAPRAGPLRRGDRLVRARSARGASAPRGRGARRARAGARTRNRSSPLLPGRVRRLDRTRDRGGRQGARGRRPAAARAELRPSPPRAHATGLARAGSVPRALAPDLRGSRRSQAPGDRAQQHGHRGLLRRRVGEGARRLRAESGAVRPDRRRRKRGHGDEQHRRDPVRPGADRRRQRSSSAQCRRSSTRQDTASCR